MPSINEPPPPYPGRLTLTRQYEANYPQQCGVLPDGINISRQAPPPYDPIDHQQYGKFKI